MPTELQSLWSVEIMLNILWPRKGVPSLRELGGTPKRISTCHRVIFHQLFLSPLGKTALRPPHITFKASSKVIFGKTSVLSAKPPATPLSSWPGLCSAHHKGDAPRGCWEEDVKRVKREEKAGETHLKVQTIICRVLSVDCDRGEIIFVRTSGENMRGFERI